MWACKRIVPLNQFIKPQNAYCIAVDDRADEQFKKQINLLMDCFPNIFVMVCYRLLNIKIKSHTDCN
jgi:hypothetical protein